MLAVGPPHFPAAFAGSELRPSHSRKPPWDGGSAAEGLWHAIDPIAFHSVRRLFPAWVTLAVAGLPGSGFMRQFMNVSLTLLTLATAPPGATLVKVTVVIPECCGTTVTTVVPPCPGMAAVGATYFGFETLDSAVLLVVFTV